MEFANTILFGAGFNLLKFSPIGCGIVCFLCIVFAIIALCIRCQVIYVDPDGDYEIEHQKKRWLSRAIVRPASKQGKTFVGWSLDPRGKHMLTEPEFVVTHTVVLYAVWADDVVEAAAKEAAEGVYVKLNYMDAEGEYVLASKAVKINAILPENQDVPVLAKGWAFEKGGKAVLEGSNVNAVFAINLYPIFNSQAPQASLPFTGKAVVELLFIDSETDKFIYKESHYLALSSPDIYNKTPSFIGWGIEQNGEAIVEKGDKDAVFAVQLYSVPAEEDEVYEEVAPVEEVAYEEPVEEEAYEEPVEEVAYEEPVEEVYEEEPVAEEPTEENIIYDDVAEEAADDSYEGAPIEEAYDEEPVIEEAYEEPTEEATEEPVVEEAYEEPAEEPVIEEAYEEPIEESPQEPVEIVPVIVPTYIDNEGNKIDIKYSRSFTANVIQSDDSVKSFYGELKNHIMSFKGVKSKISWKFDSYNRGRDQLFKIKLRGKTILLYCALDPEEFEKSKYHHDSIDAKIFADVPMLLKIKSGLGLRKAKEIVNIVMAKFGIEPNPKFKAVDYLAEYPYEENDALLEKKLVKALEADSANVIVSSKAKSENEDDSTEE